MSKIYKRLLIFNLVLAFILITAYQVMAIGMVTEYPFLGTYNVSCGYHTKCAAPTSAGYGLDFVHNTLPTSGKVAYASGRGTVIVSENATSWGETIVLDHPDQYNSRYAHLQYRFALMNQKMREGSPIGYMGNTGCGTCGAHLHFQVYDDTTIGQGVEPIPIDGKTTSFCGLGETCGPFTNNSFVTDMRLVDNTDTGFTLTGTASCSNNTTNGYHASGLGQGVVYYRYCNGTTGNPTRIGTWTPSLPTTGAYNIYVFIPNHDTLPTLSGYVEYRIYFSSTILSGIVVVNQNTSNNKWVNLGKFTLRNGGYVRLTNSSLDGDRVAFDAIMFVKDF